MVKYTPLVLTASLLLALSACGGGGSSNNDNDDDNNGNNDGTGPTNSPDAGNPSDFTPLGITSKNAEDVAGMAVSLLDLGLTSSEASNSARSLNSPKSTIQQKAAIRTIPCDVSGSTAFNGGDGDSEIEVGDYFELVDNKCATQEFDDETNEPFVETSDGPLRIDVVRVSSQTDIGYKITLNQSYSTSNGHTGSTKGSGTFTIKFDGNGSQTGSGSYNMTVSYDDKSVVFNPMQYEISIADEQYIYDYNAEIYGNAIQGSVGFKTSPSFTGQVDDDYPTSGTLTITGSNSSVILNADTGSEDTVLLTVNENGSTSSKEVTWESLEDAEPLQ